MAILTLAVSLLSLVNPSQRKHINLPSPELGGLTEVLSSKSYISSRRVAIASLFTSSASIILLPPRTALAYDNVKVVRISSPQQRLGLELTEVKIGTPSRSVVAVKSIDPFGLAAKQNVQVGTVLTDFPSAKVLIQQIQNGPYPIDLRFTNLAAGGDAIGDMGKPLVTPEDALDLARRNSGAVAVDDNNPNALSNTGFKIQVIRKPSPESCSIQSRRLDVMEIQYTASYYLDGGQKVVYDSSAQRGTGLPYQFVLGSGDMVPGVDQGLYDMCPGEIRNIDIPKQLGYGDRGNKLFRIPAGMRLNWTVKLIAVNSIREGDDRARGDMD